MRDITYCSPTRFRKRCATCYRRRVVPNELQSWANFYDKCDDYYIREVSIEEYNKRMSKIISTFSDRDMDEALIALLDEASKYRIIDNRKVKRGQKVSKTSKRVRK